MIIDIKTYIKLYGDSNLNGTNKLHRFECGWCHLPFFSTRTGTKYCCKSHSVSASINRAKKVNRGEEILKKYEETPKIKKTPPTTDELLEKVKQERSNERLKEAQELNKKIIKDNQFKRPLY